MGIMPLRSLLRGLPALLLVSVLCLPACAAPDAPSSSTTAASDTSDVYTFRTPSRDGIGKVYMGREISQVMGHRGAAWLERPSRADAERPDQVVEGMNLSSADVVADIGAGTGYFTFRIAPRVPDGRVFAVDIQPEMLDKMRTRMQREDVHNVSLVEGTVQDPRLPADSVDVALMVDAYHEFSHPREMMLNLRVALRPGGRVVLVEYRKNDPTVPIKPLHTMSEAQARKEMEAVGLEWVRTDDLPQQHLMVFRKPTDASGS